MLSTSSKSGESRLLVIASDLLDELGVAECERGDQQRAVDQWLGRNEPNKVLAFSLRRAGFLDQNVSNNLSNELRRTGPDEAGSAAGRPSPDCSTDSTRDSLPRSANLQPPYTFSMPGTKIADGLTILFLRDPDAILVELVERPRSHFR